jgi:hypothetical protein
MTKTIFRLALGIAALAGSCGTRLAFAQNPDLVLNPGSYYVDIGRGIDWGTQFNRTYVIVPNTPNSSICIYVVNNNPTSAHSFTTTTFQAADSRVADFSTNQGRYNSVPLISMPGSVPASSMVSGFTQSTAAAKVAIKFTGAISQAGSPDNADVFLVQTTSGSCGSASSALAIQGTAATGAAPVGNPVYIGGVSSDGNMHPVRVCFDSTASGCSGSVGYDVAIGAGGNTTGSGTGNGNVQTAAANGSPLLTFDTFLDATSLSNLNAAPQVGAGASAGSTVLNPRGLMVSQTGYFATFSVSVTSSGSGQALFKPPGAAATDTCYVELYITNNSGTSPTLNAFFQTSNDGTHWNDRIAFGQATTGTSNQFAAITNNAGITPANISSGTLAVGTKIDGPIGAYGKLLFNVTGTTPNYTVAGGISCK